MLNFFKKNQNSGQKISGDENNVPNLGMLQKFMMKQLMKMSEADRQKLMEEVLKPENLAKHKDEILKTIDNMQKSGQISESKALEAKKKLGF